MKIYKVKVNGKVYEVEIESVTEKEGSIVVEKKSEQVVAHAAGDQEVKSPMAGTILDVKVAAGDKVERGQTIAILEAMKLENEVVSTVSGTVKEVRVSKGQAVVNQEVLIIVG